MVQAPPASPISPWSNTTAQPAPASPSATLSDTSNHNSAVALTVSNPAVAALKLKQREKVKAPANTAFTSSPLTQRPLSPSTASDSGSESSTSTAVAIDIPKARNRTSSNASSSSYSFQLGGTSTSAASHRRSITALSFGESLLSDDEEDANQQDRVDEEVHDQFGSNYGSLSRDAYRSPNFSTIDEHTSNSQFSAGSYSPVETHHSRPVPPSPILDLSSSPSPSALSYSPPATFSLSGNRSFPNNRRRSSGNFASPLSHRAATSSPVSLSPNPHHVHSPPLSTSPSPSLFSASSSFVGSYENSILSGRMSNRPKNLANAFQFMSTLGVLGLGKSIPRGLKCPDHLSLDFGAYFWDFDAYEQSSPSQGPGNVGLGLLTSQLNAMDGLGSGKTTGKSSPYVGTLDLEEHYFSQLETSIEATSTAFSNPNHTPGEGTDISPHTTASPKFPGYRIPPKGQIQLVIKNANQTAVKLFLVPYDLTDMPPGSKTFIRQKSYDTSTVLDDTAAASSSASPASNKRSASTSPSPQPRARTKETLRYAIHLQFCAPPLKEKDRGRQHASRGHAPTHKKGVHYSHSNHYHHSARTARSEVPSASPDSRGRDGHANGNLGHRENSPLGHGYQAASPSPVRSKRDGSKHARSADSNTASHIYLYKTIRVVFTSRALDLSEKLKVVLESPTGSKVQTSSTSSTSSAASGITLNGDMTSPERYSSYAGPGEEWEQLRKRKYLAEKALERRMQLEDPIPLDPNAASLSATSSGLHLSSSSGFSGSDFSAYSQNQHVLFNTPPSIVPSERGLTGSQTMLVPSATSADYSSRTKQDSHSISTFNDGGAARTRAYKSSPLSCALSRDSSRNSLYEQSQAPPIRAMGGGEGIGGTKVQETLEPLVFERSPTPTMIQLPGLMESGLSISRPGSRSDVQRQNNPPEDQAPGAAAGTPRAFGTLPSEGCIR